MVALSGAHTIGQARCTIFRNRIYNETNIDSSFATSLKANCPTSGGDNTLAPLDLTSPNAFDNAYFRNLLSQKGLLHSDQQLFSGVLQTLKSELIAPIQHLSVQILPMQW
ncbi:hypothetical protein GH714_018968 [Hevea brasiliensis]|uniref:peroxidase n=1 Tax=Hevea brasiliensis TaxID=3981 RepID=A0A6A6M1X8_HEVBR|nr:hypothetical protein GH714_018968 [Hevea brasiliensis]